MDRSWQIINVWTNERKYVWTCRNTPGIPNSQKWLVASPRYTMRMGLLSSCASEFHSQEKEAVQNCLPPNISASMIPSRIEQPTLCWGSAIALTLLSVVWGTVFGYPEITRQPTEREMEQERDIKLRSPTAEPPAPSYRGRLNIWHVA